jgi:hypothetical protein
MKANLTLIAIVFMIFSSGDVIAQEKKQGKTRFSSAYTSLGKACKVLKGSNGGDDAYLCNGVGAYRVRVYSSAAATHIVAEIKGTDEILQVATVSAGFDESRSRIEWRLANGRPFAVIMRIPRYGPPTDDHPSFGEAVGQELAIKGLKGFASLNASVGARTPGANAKARARADKAYLEQRTR